jgi:hypothetical protein
MRIVQFRWLLLFSVAVIFAIGGISGGLHVVAGGAVGVSVGVVLMVAYGYFRPHRTR